MSVAPLITFKAGQCEIDVSMPPYLLGACLPANLALHKADKNSQTDSEPHKVKAQSQQGYIYLYVNPEDGRTRALCRLPVRSPHQLDTNKPSQTSLTSAGVHGARRSTMSLP
jgi:hypothetical protein